MRFSFLLVAPVLALVGCVSSGDETGSSGSDFSTAPSPSPDVPRYSPTDTAYWTIVRTSVDGGEFVEERTASAVALPDFAGPDEWGFTTRPDLFVRFGVAGARKLEVGTYSCTDGDATIFSTQLNPDHTWQPLLRPAACSVVVDEINPAPGAASNDYLIVTGRFEASKAAGGLPVDVKGAFVGYFSIRREAQQH